MLRCGPDPFSQEAEAEMTDSLPIPLNFLSLPRLDHSAELSH
jgi:hypothetical protein